MSYTGTPERMETTAAQIAKVPQNLEQAYAALENAMKIYQAANNGATVEAYTSAQLQWASKHGEITAAGAHASKALLDIAATMRQADQQGASLYQ
ncbi:WXG100 family type VII secretion target [Micromonospora sp. NPDC049366]|uniref:WXG100 family type VII secretion target n=1 Tax=Micromonospora violae TaxID=1278207 RepID=A0A4Q7UE33_9ACTN|nr:WXG100 family type VII secretion target [Micromonospora violae]RZT79455.1 WXG100 family type VII secretion target [Micromonospora violae]